MRNLKRALSLLLSSTMVLGMLVMGGSAAGYKDVDASNDHQEAIEVLQAVGIMTGDQNGKFNPDGSITRNEMAVIMAHLLNLNYDYYRGTNPFTDVPEWAAPYVAACAAEGVVAGIGNGQFGGNQKVTAAQASLMIMKALGYFQNAEDFGTDWQVATIRQASYINLFDNINANAESALTRAQVAQLVLNGLKAKMVDFTGDKGIQIGDVTVGYHAEYTARTNAAEKYNSIDVGTTNIAQNDQFYIQLGEELYNGDLKLRNDGEDVFGRPSRVWSYKGDEIGTYAKKELIRETYTTEVKGGEVYSDIGSAACKYDLTYWVDGVKYSKTATAAEAAKLDSKNDDPVATTGNGVLTEVYVDTNAKELTIVEVHTYLAQANADYNSKTEKLSLTVYTGVDTPYMNTSIKAPKEITIARTVSAEDFDIADYKKDDIVLVTYAGDDREIQSIADPKVVSDVTLTSYSTYGKDANQKAYMMKAITADGTNYSAAEDAAWQAEYLYDYSLSQLKDHTWNVYLDQYGYVLGLENVEAATNYAFLVGYEAGSNVLAQAIDKALVIMIDSEGNSVLKTVDARDNKMTSAEHSQLFASTTSGNINRWVTYEMDGDVMELKTCVDEQFYDNFASRTFKVDRENATLEGTDLTSTSQVVYGNASSVYVSVDADYSVIPDGGSTGGSIVAINGTTTGIKNTSIDVYNWNVSAEEATTSQPGWTNHANGAYVLYKDGYVKYAVVVGEDGSIADRLVYLTDGISEKKYDSELDSYLYIYSGVSQGELSDEIISEVATDTAGNQLKEGVLYVASYDANGIITKMTAKTDNWMTANTVNNKDAKYVQATGGANGLADSFALNLKGATLYITAASNNHYVILDDNCVFYVDGMNEKNTKETGYERYTDAENALSALGNSDLVTGTFVAICDADTGYATTIIINDDYYEGYGTPGAPSGYMVNWTSPAVTLTGTTVNLALSSNMWISDDVSSTNYVAANNVVVSYKIASWNTSTGTWNDPVVVESAEKDLASSASIQVAGMGASYVAGPGRYQVTVTVTSDKVTQTMDPVIVNVT